MVSRFERRHPRADFLDNADALVTENAAGLAGRNIALEDVQVGAANRRLGYFDDGIGGRRDFRLRTFLQGFLARSRINKGLHCQWCCNPNASFRLRRDIHDLYFPKLAGLPISQRNRRRRAAATSNRKSSGPWPRALPFRSCRRRPAADEHSPRRAVKGRTLMQQERYADAKAGTVQICSHRNIVPIASTFLRGGSGLKAAFVDLQAPANPRRTIDPDKPDRHHRHLQSARQSASSRRSRHRQTQVRRRRNPAIAPDTPTRCL